MNSDGAVGPEIVDVPLLVDLTTTVSIKSMPIYSHRKYESNIGVAFRCVHLQLMIKRPILKIQNYILIVHNFYFMRILGWIEQYLVLIRIVTSEISIVF